MQSSQSLHDRAEKLYATRSYAEALPLFTRASASSSIPLKRRCHARRSACLQLLGKHAKSIEAATASIDADPAHAEGWACRGTVQYGLRHHAEALTDWAEALSRAPPPPIARAVRLGMQHAEAAAAAARRAGQERTAARIRSEVQAEELDAVERRLEGQLEEEEEQLRAGEARAAPAPAVVSVAEAEAPGRRATQQLLLLGFGHVGRQFARMILRCLWCCRWYCCCWR